MDHFLNESSDSIDMQSVVDSTVEDIQVNKVMQGQIVTVDASYAYVNVGMKSDGRIPLGEFDNPPAAGDSVDIILRSRKFVDGLYQFSHKAAVVEKVWREFLSMNKTVNSVISGRITGSVKNGKSVLCAGVNAFLPFSLIGDLKPVSGGDREYEFVIKTIDSSKKSIVVSRKDFLETEKVKRWDEFTETYKAGDRIHGEVVRFVEFGVFVNVAGIDALLHKNDISWKKVFKQKQFFKEGDVKEFLILDINREEGKISLGYKQLAPDPWSAAEEKFKTGDVVDGRVNAVTNFGAFVELDGDIEGFVNQNELSWTRNNPSPNDYLKKGETCKFAVLGFNQNERRLILGYKQTQPNPWDSISEKYPVGSTGSGKIKNIVKFGMFVELDDQIEGLVHISDITWDESVKDPAAAYKSGDTVDFKVLEIRKKDMKISLGIKQLGPSPWEKIREKYPVRTLVDGVVSGITAYGLFVKIEDNVEGLVHISEASNSRIEKLEEHFKIGDRVSAVVLDIDVNKKRLSLSIKHFDKISEKEELDKIMKGTKPSAVTIGDLVNLKWEK